MEGTGIFVYESVFLLTATRALKCSPASSLAGEKHFNNKNKVLVLQQVLIQMGLLLLYFTAFINICFSLRIFCSCSLF